MGRLVTSITWMLHETTLARAVSQPWTVVPTKEVLTGVHVSQCGFQQED